MPHHARAAMWTERGERRWFHRCDQCGRWRIVGHYFEVYPPLGRRGPESGWWWACADCLSALLSDRLEEAKRVLENYEQWEADLIEDDDAWAGSDVCRLTRRHYDRLIEIQQQRNGVIHP